jgi:hypothetical protein
MITKHPNTTAIKNNILSRAALWSGEVSAIHNGTVAELEIANDGEYRLYCLIGVIGTDAENETPVWKIGKLLSGDAHVRRWAERVLSEEDAVKALAKIDPNSPALANND